MNDKSGATLLPVSRAPVEAFLREMRVDLRNKDYCELYLLIEFEESPPPPYKAGWHFKRFPAKMGLPEILVKRMGDHMTWPIKQPPDEDGRQVPRIILPN